jgi:hypothetical protein
MSQDILSVDLDLLCYYVNFIVFFMTLFLLSLKDSLFKSVSMRALFLNCLKQLIFNC